MTIPKRLLEDESVPADLRAALSRAANVPRMSPAVDARLRAFSGQLVLGVVGTATASAATASAATASTATASTATIGVVAGPVTAALTSAKMLTLVVAGVGMLMASGTAGYVAMRSFERKTIPAASSAVAATSVTGSLEIPERTRSAAKVAVFAEPVLASKVKVPEGGRDLRASEESTHVQDTSLLAREARMLEVARSALGSDPAQALEITREHGRLFPKAQLSDERELIAVDALLRLGRRTEAWERAKTRILQGKESLYAKRLRQLFGPDVPEE